MPPCEYGRVNKVYVQSLCDFSSSHASNVAINHTSTILNPQVLPNPELIVVQPFLPQTQHSLHIVLIQELLKHLLLLFAKFLPRLLVIVFPFQFLLARQSLSHASLACWVQALGAFLRCENEASFVWSFALWK